MSDTKDLDLEESNFFIFQTPFVWWKKIKSHKKIKNTYLPLIMEDIKKNGRTYNKKNTWNCDIVSSFFDDSDKNNFNIFDQNFFEKIIWEPIDELIEQMNPILNVKIPRTSNIAKIWYNHYKGSHWQEIHNHSIIPIFPESPTSYSVPSFSGIYIMNLEYANTTCFTNESKSINCISLDSSQILTTKKMEEGYVIIFPSELMHYVNYNNSYEDRITVSFNVISKY
jgi:hypothetical protein